MIQSELAHVRSVPNLMQAILHWADATRTEPALRFHRDGEWHDLSWGELGRRVRATAAGLTGLGVRPGDRVAICSANRPEWALADLGALAAGAVVVSVYPNLPADDVAFPLEHAGCKVVFVEDSDQAAKVATIRDRLPDLEHVVLLAQGPAVGCLTLADLESATGTGVVLAGLERRREDLLTILYTSGTTGVPKGVQLTHGNVLAVLDAAIEGFGDELPKLRRNLSFLPLAHALERLGGHFLPLILGRTICYARSLETLADDFRIVRPEFAVAVPRVFEKIHSRILTGVAAAPAWRRALFDVCLSVGVRCSRLEETGEPLPRVLRWQRAVADRLVFRRLRAALGGEIELLVSGGAPLAADVARFFHAAGLLICEGWGATETAAPSTFNTPRGFRFGSVGRPLPGVELEVADDGELLVRGPNVFPGYWRQPELDAEVFDDRGFWRTGDVGHIDADGFVWITDRKKELIITSGGKNIAPQRIESLLKQRPGISNAMTFGDRRPYLVALVTVDREALRSTRPELADLAIDDPRLAAALEPEVEEVNRHLARYESVRRFRLVEPDFSAEGGELTVTLKLKRRVVAERHREAIEGLYRE